MGKPNLLRHLEKSRVKVEKPPPRTGRERDPPEALYKRSTTVNKITLTCEATYKTQI